MHAQEESVVQMRSDVDDDGPLDHDLDAEGNCDVDVELEGDGHADVNDDDAEEDDAGVGLSQTMPKVIKTPQKVVVKPKNEKKAEKVNASKQSAVSLGCDQCKNSQPVTKLHHANEMNKCLLLVLSMLPFDLK